MRYSLIAGAYLACGLRFSVAIGGEPSAVPGPVDSPIPLTRTDAATLENLIKPLIAQAQSTYPSAKARFTAGLPAGYRFFVVTRLHDDGGRFEQAFVRALAVTPEGVSGRLATKLTLLDGPSVGTTMVIADRDVIDWVITDANGTEEGNVVGKFMDAYHAGNHDAPTIAQGAATPDPYVNEVAKAEAEGAALYAAAKKPAAVDDAILAAAKQRISTFCEFTYTPVLITTNGDDVLYLVASAAKPTDIVIGRHFRISGSEITPSTNACLNLGTPPPGVAAASVTNVLTATPNAIHVYLSLKHSITLLVRTDAATWAVEHGSIRYLKANDK